MQLGAVVAGDVFDDRPADRVPGRPGLPVGQLVLHRGENDSKLALSQHRGAVLTAHC